MTSIINNNQFIVVDMRETIQSQRQIREVRRGRYRVIILKDVDSAMERLDQVMQRKQHQQRKSDRKTLC